MRWFYLAIVIVFVACHQGLNTKNGAVGVGRAPTESVVLGSLAGLRSPATTFSPS